MQKYFAARWMTKDALAVLAPDEVFLLENFDPAQSTPGAVAKGPQGFGASETIILLLPVIYSFFSKFVESMGTEAGKRTFGALHEWVAKKDSSLKSEAEIQVRRALIEGGMPEASLNAAADTILAILAKQG